MRYSVMLVGALVLMASGFPSHAEPIQDVMKDAVIAWWPNGPANHEQWLKITSARVLEYHSLDGTGSWVVSESQLKGFLDVATKNRFCSIKSHPETKDREDSWATLMIRQKGRTCSVTEIWNQSDRSPQLAAISAAFATLRIGPPIRCCSDIWF